MVNVLSKQPPIAAPWPPSGPGLEKKIVNPGETLGDFCKRAGVTVSDFMQTNFAIDLRHPDWQFHFNWYMKKKGIAKAWTPNGNCKFIGGETFYVKKKKSPSTAPTDRGGAVQWFLQEVLPARTIGPGNITNGSFMKSRLGKVIDRFRGGDPDPNGICGAAADYVVEKYQDFGNQTPFTMGYILWRQGPMFTHVANFLAPQLTVLSYTRDFAGNVAGAAPEAGYVLPYSSVQHWTVLDLYFMKASTVENWWRAVSYLGWGTLTLDPSGQFINE